MICIDSFCIDRNFTSLNIVSINNDRDNIPRTQNITDSNISKFEALYINDKNNKTSILLKQ
jgi:hypothetical protein